MNGCGFKFWIHKNSFVIFLVVLIRKNKLKYAGLYLLGEVGKFYPKLNIFPPKKCKKVLIMHAHTTLSIHVVYPSTVSIDKYTITVLITFMCT